MSPKHIFACLVGPAHNLQEIKKKQLSISLSPLQVNAGVESNQRLNMTEMGKVIVA